MIKVTVGSRRILVQKRLQIKIPLYVNSDFNVDNSRDYAVQVLGNNSIQMLAFLD